MDLREIRRRLGLTQGQLAQRLDVAQASVSRWESDRCEPSGPAAILLRQLADEAASRPDPGESEPGGSSAEAAA